MKNIHRFIVITSLLMTGAYSSMCQWIQTTGSPTMQVNSLAFSGTYLYAGTSISGLFRSTDYGASWTNVAPSWVGPVDALLILQAGTTSQIYTGSQGNYVYLSSDSGATWIPRYGGLTSTLIVSLGACPNGTGGTNLFAGAYYNGSLTEPGGLFMSTNGGVTWTRNTSLTAPPMCFTTIPNAAGGTDLFVATYSSGVWRSTDYGTNWTDTGLRTLDYKGQSIAPQVYALAVAPNSSGGKNLFAGTYGSGVYRSLDNGKSWIPANNGLTNGQIHALVVSDTNIFAATHQGGVYLSSINRLNWTAVNIGMPSREVHALAISGTNLFAGTWGSGVWRRSLSEITDVQKPSDNLPRHFALEQNYPNPFNPSTHITFDLPSRSMVSLKIFDALGREVSRLVEDELAAGTHTRQWNAAGMPSGIYFVRLQTGEASSGSTNGFVETKKMVVLK
jgi:hypothetical protein